MGQKLLQIANISQFDIFFIRCSFDGKRAGEVLEEAEVDDGGAELCGQRGGHR